MGMREDENGVARPGMSFFSMVSIVVMLELGAPRFPHGDDLQFGW